MKCKFCGGNTRGFQKYCDDCSEERQRLAAEHFARDGKVSVERGDYVLRVLPEHVKEGDVLR